MRRLIATMPIAIALLASCGGSDGTQSDVEPDSTEALTVAMAGPGLSTAPMLAAAERLRDQGYTVDIAEVSAPELVAEGVAKGDFAFGTGSTNSVMAAVVQGADLQVIAERVANEVVLDVRTATIDDCADLDGQRLAIHSEAAAATAMTQQWIEDTCLGTTPNYLIIAGSPNRLAAFVADQIDASPIEIADSVALQRQAGDRFGTLVSFAEELPDVSTVPIYTNGAVADDNPETVVAFVTALLEEHREVAADPGYLQQIAQQHVEEGIDPETIDAAAQRYVDLGMFDPDGGLTEDKLLHTAEFFGPAGTGAVDRELDVHEFADLSYLEQALTDLGRD